MHLLKNKIYFKITTRFSENNPALWCGFINFDKHRRDEKYFKKL